MDSAKVDQRPLPERVGRYEVLLKVASGGMATVYLARAHGIGGFEREVALKLMHSHLQESSEFADDLVEEAKLAVRIRHSNVASILDVGEDPLGIYLVMDFVEGDTLSGLLKVAAATDEKIPVRIGLRILVDALAGLHAAHECKDAAGKPLGIVHRDFSPQNILVGLDGVARLADFGIARAATRLSQTNTGIVKGKIAYMAPEQARGEAVDRRCDVWAAGVVTWQVITGKKLYAAENDLAALLKIATVEPPRLRSLDRTVSGPLDEAVASALTMDLAKRCPTASTFRHALVAAARAKDALAEHEEVAEYVEKAVGQRLAARRERIAELLALRERMGKLADGARDERSGMTPAHGAPRTSSHSIPLVVVPPPAHAEVEELDVEPDPAPDDQPLTTTTATNEDDEATRLRERPPEDEATRLRERPPEAEPATGTRTSTVSVATSDWVKSPTTPSRRSRIVLAAIGGATVALFVTIVVLASGAHDPSSQTTSSAESSAAATPTPPPTTDRAAEPSTVALMLHGNAPIVSARVAGRPVTIPTPEADVSLDVSTAEAATTLRVDAYDARGRHASASIPPGTIHVTLVFPNGPMPAAAPPRAASSSPFVSTSPYEKKK
jgi:serine/threonine protein kinase